VQRRSGFIGSSSQTSEFAVHLERYEQRPVGVVLVADRGAEEGERRVPATSV
jgi:hypothetical protein